MLAYVAGKYTAPTKEEVQMNINAAEKVGKQTLLMGMVPIIPHRISAHWENEPEFAHMSHKDWMESYCFPMLDACDAIVMVPGWQESPGSCMEHARAKEQQMPVFYMEAF